MLDFILKFRKSALRKLGQAYIAQEQARDATPFTDTALNSPPITAEQTSERTSMPTTKTLGQ